MSAAFPATFCDGQTLRSFPVLLEPEPNGTWRIRGENFERVLPLDTLVASAPLGRLPRFLRLADGGVIEVASDTDLDAALRGPRRANLVSDVIHWLESHSSVAATATVLLVMVVGTLFWQGLPRLGRRVAFLAPATIETAAGRTGDAVFTRAFQVTQLSAREQQRVRRQLKRLEQVQPLHVTPTLHFIAMPAPNAFALPGGIVVMTDSLVRLAKTDEQLAAVLAHEVGHIELRHGLQSILRNSAALVIVSSVTGDLSTLSTFSGTLPFLLLQYGYAREFESEADDYARTLLEKAQIDPRHLADILQLLENARPKSGADFSYLSTHPSTKDRIRALHVPSPTLPAAAKKTQ